MFKRNVQQLGKAMKASHSLISTQMREKTNAS